MARRPIFVQTPKCPSVRISVANGARDGSGAMGDLFTAGPNGAYFDGFRYQRSDAVNGAGVVRFFIQRNGSGNIELKREIAVPSITPSTSQEAANEDWYPAGGIRLDAGDKVFVSTNGTATISCWLEGGGDY